MIRIKDSDIKRVEKLVKNFNSKINRINKKQDGTNIILPSKVSKKELLNIKDRRDFNNKLNSLERFLRKGSEKLVTKGNVITTKWQLREYSIQLRSINLRKRNKYLKTMREEYGNFGAMNSNRFAEFMPRGKFKFNEYSNISFKKYLETNELMLTLAGQEKRTVSYIENYIQGLYDEYGHHKYVDELVDIINNVDISRFKDFYLANPEMDINYYYNPPEHLKRYLIEQLKTYWKQIEVE